MVFDKQYNIYCLQSIIIFHILYITILYIIYYILSGKLDMDLITVEHFLQSIFFIEDFFKCRFLIA